jgi:hypothetical protein
VSQYSTVLKGSKISMLSGMGPNIPYLPVSHYLGNTISDGVIQQYLYNLVLYGVLTVSPDSSNVGNIVAIHMGQGMKVTRNTTTGLTTLCKDMCGYHDMINISSLTNGATKRLLYTVVGYSENNGSSTASNCPACLDYPQEPQVIPLMASHEVVETMVAEALADNINLNSPEVADICAWSYGLLYNPVRKVYVEGSAIYDGLNNVCYTGPSVSNNASLNPVLKADSCFYRPTDDTAYLLYDYNFESYSGQTFDNTGLLRM